MTFDSQQMEAIKEIVREELDKKFEDVATRKQFSDFMTQVNRANQTLNNGVNRMMGKMDGFTALIDARNETISDLKTKTQRNEDLYEDLSERFGLVVSSIYGSELSTGESLIEIVKRNAKSIEIISKWVEKENERRANQALWMDRFARVGLSMWSNTAIRWIILLGGGTILGIGGEDILKSLIK